jgi:glucose-1-phosphate cytidylyltransferase
METLDLSQVPVIILAGGNGYVDPEHEYKSIPKPLVCVAGAPILVHTINHYRKAGFKSFYIAAGSGLKQIKSFEEQFVAGKFDSIKDPFTNSLYPGFKAEDCKLHVFETGDHAGTGSRVSQVAKILGLKSTFCVSYGDTVSNVDIRALLNFHFAQKKIATLVASHCPTRFRILGLLEQDPIIRGLSNKPVLNKDFINGGYYVFEPELISTTKIDDSLSCILETEVLEDLIKRRQVAAFRHSGFWWFVDSERDRKLIAKELDTLSASIIV